jgi:choline kinase/phosphatidylglycerophosphate synthase
MNESGREAGGVFGGDEVKARFQPRIGIVLAAGRSERLHEVTGGGSKALVRLGGITLVERAVRTLVSGGLEEVIVVVGYHAGPVGAVVSRIGLGRVRTVLAEQWERGNGASLAAAEAAVKGGELFVLVTTDHVFGEDALHDLLHSTQPAVLVDPNPSPDVWLEGTRVRVRGERVTDLGKQLQEPAVDCGAFVLQGEIFPCQRLAAAEGDHSLARAVALLAERKPLRGVRLRPSAWWCDIDTPEDLRTARSALRRSLGRASDGPVSRYLNRPLSTRISAGIAPLRPSPDVLSYVALLVALLGAWLAGTGRGILAAVAIQAASVLDGVDGEIARLQVRARALGAMLDGVFDRVGDTAIIVGFGLWALSRTDYTPRAILVLTATATAGALMSMASKDRAAALGLPPAPERTLGWLLGGRDTRLLILAAGAAFGRPLEALAVISATSAVTLVIRLLFLRFGSGRGGP